MELKIDMLNYHIYHGLHKGTNVYGLHKATNVYLILKLVNQVALFHHGTAVTHPFKQKSSAAN